MRLRLAAFLLAAAATPALAQVSTTIVEPVPTPSTSIISAPIEYDANGVAKAQYFKAEDLSPEELAALYAEADRVRSYQQANGIYVRPETAAPVEVYETAVAHPNGSYEIELYADPIETYSTSPTVIAPAPSAQIHTVVKGDTLYNISRRYSVTVTDLQQANGISGSAISLGQAIRIPASQPQAYNTSAPSVTFASAPQPVIKNDGYVTRRVIEPVAQTAPVRSVTSATDTVYAVLPKDTLYAISRRTCVKVPALIAANAIADANALKPGQRLTIPAGHCLAN